MIFRCVTSARILPLLRSTSSSIFGMNPAISRGRAARASGSPPASRTATYLATVFASHPVSCAADQAVPVRSNASKISTISLPDLVMGPSGHRWVRRITQNPSTPEGPPTSRHAGYRQRTKATNPDPDGRGTGETMAANRELTGRTPAFFVAASTTDRRLTVKHPLTVCSRKVPYPVEFACAWRWTPIPGGDGTGGNSHPLRCHWRNHDGHDQPRPWSYLDRRCRCRSGSSGGVLAA